MSKDQDVHNLNGLVSINFFRESEVETLSWSVTTVGEKGFFPLKRRQIMRYARSHHDGCFIRLMIWFV